MRFPNYCHVLASAIRETARVGKTSNKLLSILMALLRHSLLLVVSYTVSPY